MIGTIALRNLLRNRRRSLLTLSAIGFGLGALIFLCSFVEGAERQMAQNIKTLLTGDLQIAAPGLEEVYNTNSFIEEPETIRKRLKEDRRILSFSERIVRGGLVTFGDRSIGTFLIGIDPESEKRVGTSRPVVVGRGLLSGDHQGILIGEKLREILRLNVGEPVILTSQDYYGSLGGARVTVIGSFRTGNDVVDSGTVYLLKETAQQMLSLEGQISEFVLKLKPGVDPAAMKRDLGKQIPSDIARVLSWEDLIPLLAQMHRFQEGMMMVVLAIVVLVVAAGILNTLMMSFIERIREFGLIAALGARSLTIGAVVVAESALLTSFGLLGGFLIGWGMTLFWGYQGLDLSRFVSTLSNLFIGTRLYPQMDWSSLVVFAVTFFLASLVASLLPAWRAGSLCPVEAMRQTG